MADRTTILTTSRLRLTTWLDDDLDDLAALHADPEVVRYLGDGSPETRSRVRGRLTAYLREQDERGWTKWRVEDHDGVMVGRGGFGAFDGGREIGYTLARAVWGQGLATELATALVQWDREHAIPGRPLVGFALLDNAASRRVLEKSGFTYVGTRDHHDLPHAFYEIPAAA